MFASGPFGFSGELNCWNITTGVPQLPTSSPLVAGGAARWRNTPDTGALFGENRSWPHADWLTARTEYQKLLGPGVAGAPALVSSSEFKLAFASCETMPTTLFDGVASLVSAIAGFGQR